MDDILAKHLAKTLLFKENRNLVINKPIKTQKSVIENQYNYKLIDGKYYINTENDIIISEKIGIWKNKDIVKVNEENYVIMESSQTMIPLRHLSNEEFDRNFISLDKIPKTIIKKSKSFRDTSSLPIFKKENNTNNKEELEKNHNNISEEEEPENLFNNINEEENIENLKDTSTAKYINDIKKSTNSSSSKEFEEDAEENQETDSFFNMLEKKKDDPRVKKFFNYHADAMKKEFYQIAEKMKSSQMSRAMESGGGTNAVQYANGGIMNGVLNVTEKIISEEITDNKQRQLVFKKTFDIIGNGFNNTFTYTHNFGTKDILVNIYDSNYQLVFVSSVNIDLNNTRITFPNNLQEHENYRVILFA